MTNSELPALPCGVGGVMLTGIVAEAVVVDGTAEPVLDDVPVVVTVAAPDERPVSTVWAKAGIAASEIMRNVCAKRFMRFTLKKLVITLLIISGLCANCPQPIYAEWA
jgi:hypothetical protein